MAAHIFSECLYLTLFVTFVTKTEVWFNDKFDDYDAVVGTITVNCSILDELITCIWVLSGGDLIK